MQAAEKEQGKRGLYIFQAAGGCACHTDVKNKGAFMAGGRAIKTPFGILYSTNITPDRKEGIGSWSDLEFIQAMRQGKSPQGQHYFPVFPYTSFTGMNEEDLLSLKAYLFSLDPVSQKNKDHQMLPPFGWRWTLRFWKFMGFNDERFRENTSQSALWNRGAYLASSLAHCGECHTPRNLMGTLKADWHFAGSEEGPEGELAPNITPDEDTGIGKWSEEDIIWFLQTGQKPDGDDAQGLMGEIIDQGYQYMEESDLKAIATYLRTLKPISNKIEPKELGEK